MFGNYSAVYAGASIEKDDYVRIKREGEKTVAYPVSSQYDRALLPIAAEDAERGEIVTIRP